MCLIRCSVAGIERERSVEGMTDLISDKHCSHECVCPYYSAYTIEKEPCVLPCVDRLNLLSDELAKERENVLGDLKKDLKTRFIASSNQWSTGRNSGLIECCNIIDDTLRSESRECPR